MYPVRAAKFRNTPFVILWTVFLVSLSVLAVTSLPAGAQESQGPESNLPVLSLRDCLEVALGDSPILMVSDEQRHIASQDVTGAWGQFLPTISLGYDWQKAERTDFDQNQYVSGPNLHILTREGIDLPYPTSIPAGQADETIITKYKGLNGQVRLNVFQGFAKFSRLSSAKNSLKAAEATRDYTRERVVEDVTSAYFNLLRFQRLLEVAVETRDQTQLELDRTETYFRLGSAAKSDVLQQRVQVENAKLDVVVADNTVKKAFADLAYNMNRPLAEGFTIDESILDTDYNVPNVDALYTEALANRLDLISSEHNLNARNKDVTTATSAAWPSFDVYLNHTRYENDSPFRFGSSKSASTTYGWSASWNVFDRLLTWTGRSQAKANARIAEYQLQQAKLNVQVEVRQLYNSLVEAREKAHVSRETIIQSEEELRLARERFRVGAGTTLDIILAQANLTNSKAQEVQAMCDFLITQTQMYRAVGRTNAWAGEQ
ncbi:MAG: TolC family protein [Candidatus Krumholzibacteria bacterium]|nr:TolC family protein [Candidatus Krumholzibacteria bacterium]